MKNIICSECGDKTDKGYFNDIDLYDQLDFNYSEKPKCRKCFKKNDTYIPTKTLPNRNYKRLYKSMC